MDKRGVWDEMSWRQKKETVILKGKIKVVVVVLVVDESHSSNSH